MRAMTVDAIGKEDLSLRTARFVAMGMTNLDHRYGETHLGEECVASSTGLSVVFAAPGRSEGHGASLLAPGSDAVVLAEAGVRYEPGLAAFFLLTDAASFAVGDSVEVVTPLEGTREGIRVHDLEGRADSHETCGAPS